MKQQALQFGDLEKPARDKIDLPLDSDGNTYLHLLCNRNAPPEFIVEAVTELGANINILNKDKLPPLGLALLHGRAETAAALVRLGSPLYFDTGGGAFFNAVWLAVRAGREGLLGAVLENGGGLHINQGGIDDNGHYNAEPCLHVAIAHYRHYLIPDLLAAGAFLERGAGPLQYTPLMLAAALDMPEVVRVLAAAGAQPDTLHAEGYTALNLAAYFNKQNAALALLEAGADPNVGTKNNLTPLMDACSNDNLVLVEALLLHGARPDAQKQDTLESAMMMAAERGNASIVRKLLQAGAALLLTDSFNKTASDHAEVRMRYGVADVLRQKELELQEERSEKTYNLYKNRPK